MAASQPMKVSILIGADASGAQAGGAVAEQAMDGVTKAANDAGTAINKLIGESTGLNKAFASVDTRSSDLAAYGAQLDALRAKYNPLYATVQRYKTEVQGIRDAHRVGAISTNEMTAAISRERQATLSSIDAIKGRNAALRSMPTANGNAAAFQTSNIAAQFQDIGVSIAGGMSPLQIALQQGTQLSAVFASLRTSGVGLGASLFSALGQVVSPISLITIGVIAAGSALVQYVMSASSGARSLDDILSQHAENIRGLKDAYGDAAAGLQEYVTESKTVLLANLAGNQADARAAVLEAAQDAYSNIIGRSQDEFKGPIASYNAFAIAAEDLRRSIAAGTPDILGFRNAISEIAIDPAASESQRKLALELRNLDEEVVKIARSLPKVADAIATLQGASQRGFLISDDRQRQALGEALTETYLRQKKAIEEIYKAGVTSRGAMVTNAEQLLKLEQAITEEYIKQRTAITSRGFQVTDKASLIAQEKALTETYLRQQSVLKQTRDAQAAFDAQQLSAAARSPQEKANAARAIAGAQVITGEDADVRAQRIELAGKQALAAAERDLTRAQEDRARSLQASVDAQQFELSIAGKSIAEQQRLRTEYQQIAALKAEAARAGTTVDQREVELIRQKADEYARLSQAIAGQNVVKSQTDDIDKLRLEISLVGESAEVRSRALAAYEAEKQIRDAGIQSISREADAIRANAQTRAELLLQLERQQAAYQATQQAGSTMIDQLVVGTGSLKDRLRSMTETLLTTFQQLAFANPLKNQLLGTNMPTLGDLFSGKPASPIGATTTGAMTVTAGTVMINGVPLTGLSNPLTAANNNIPFPANNNAPLSSSVDAVNALRAPAVAPAGNIEAYIRQSAIARGINPDTAVAVARSEGGLNSWNQQSNVINAAGMREQSFGPYQLYMGGGLGNRFQSQTGLDPRLAGNGPAGVDFALDTASKEGWGAWYGARNAGISNWQGIGKNPGVDPINTNGITKLNTTAQQAATQVNTMGTGALDASKALTEGNNSLLSSVTQVAQPAAPAVAAPTTAAPASGNIFSGLFGAIGQGISGIGSVISKLFNGIFGMFFADGAAFSDGNVIPFATGGVVSRPTLFPMSGGRRGVMGEAGPEAIMPLRRGPGGRLGVSMAMPKQMRQSRADMNLRLNSTNTLYVQGVGDKELMERFQLANAEQHERSKAELRHEFPRMMEDYRRNPWAVNY